MHGNCTICGMHNYLQPLHGDKGGPLCCILCSGSWHGKHGRRRRLGRIAIRAIAAYLNGGGGFKDIDAMKVTAATVDLWGGIGIDPLGYFTDSGGIGGEPVELTSELLADAIKIVHPDVHPPERRDLAQRVTQGLLALQPFTFPEKPKPKSTPEPGGARNAAPSKSTCVSRACHLILVRNAGARSRSTSASHVKQSARAANERTTTGSARNGAISTSGASGGTSSGSGGHSARHARRSSRASVPTPAIALRPVARERIAVSRSNRCYRPSGVTNKWGLPPNPRNTRDRMR